jgi:DNA-binding transcriptional MocR family regulator
MIYERGEFGIFPAKLVNGLSPNLQVVLSWLIYHTNTKTKTCFPSHTTLCRETGIKSRTTIIQALTHLEELGYIRKNKRMRDDGGYSSNEYEVFIKGSSPFASNEHDTIQQMDTNHKKINQKNYNIELFEKCWVDYERKGNKQMALRYWKKLSTDDQQAVHNSIPIYKSNREFRFRKDFQGWINPSNRMWEDEIERKEIRSI